MTTTCTYIYINTYIDWLYIYICIWSYLHSIAIYCSFFDTSPYLSSRENLYNCNVPGVWWTVTVSPHCWRGKLGSGSYSVVHLAFDKKDGGIRVVWWSEDTGELHDPGWKSTDPSKFDGWILNMTNCVNLGPLGTVAPRFLCRHVAQLACKENQLVAVKFEWQNAEKTAAGSRVRCWKWAVWGLRVSLKWGFLLSFPFPAPVVGSAAQHLEGFLFGERVVSLSSQCSRQVEQEYPLAVNMQMELSPIHQEKHPCKPFCGGFPIAIFDYWRVHQELSWPAPFSWAFPKRRGWRGRQPWRNFSPLDHPRVPDSVVPPQWNGYINHLIKSPVVRCKSRYSHHKSEAKVPIGGTGPG